MSSIKVTLWKIGDSIWFKDGFYATLEAVYTGSFFFRAERPIERQAPDGTRLGLGDCFHLSNQGDVVTDRDGCKVGKYLLMDQAELETGI